MAVPRKKFHPITVDGERYRWFVRSILHQDGFMELLELRIVAEERSNPVILGTINTGHDPEAAPPFVFLPRHIEAIIRHASSKGWDPQSTRADFRLDHPERFIEGA